MMKNKLIKNIFIICISFLLLSKVSAQISKGSTVVVDSEKWIVKDVKNLNNQCDLNNPTPSNRLHVTSKEFPTIGYTYENTCQEVKTVCTTYYTKALTEPQYLESINSNYNSSSLGSDVGDPQGEINAEGQVKSGPIDMSIPVIDDPSGDTGYKYDKNIKMLASVTKTDSINRSYKIKRLLVPSEGFEAGAINGYYAESAARMETKGYFTAFYAMCSGQKTRNCKVWVPPETICSGTSCDSKGKNCMPTDCTTFPGYYQSVPVAGKKLLKWNWPDPNNTTSVSVSDFKAIVPEPSPCPAGLDDGVTDNSYCSAPYYRAPITVCTDYCAKTGPTKVEVFNYDLKINGKDTYCVTPAAGYNKTYVWDKRFNVSNCKNSLQKYNKDGSTSYDIDCGYAYIMAEAKRLNAEVGKEIFSNGVISTAMKLFGTGIVGNKDENGNQLFFSDMLEDAIDNKKFLQAGGYYSSYYGWGYGEYVGIPYPRGGEYKGPKSGIFAYFMPEFYSIYIHTARVSGAYLKQNIRFADIGNLKDDNGILISDPFYYLNPKECKSTPTKNECQKSTNISYNDAYSQARVNMFIPMSDALMNYLQRSNSINACFDSSLGVMCGKKNEKGNADYIKSIYLYMRALQGNEIVFEPNVENKIDQYKPIEGQTKFLYEVDDNGEISPVIRFAIDTKIETESVTKQIEVDCDGSPGSPSKEQCKAEVFVFDSKGRELFKTEYYDYCKKNYCYVKVKSKAVCDVTGENKKMTALVITDPALKSTIIKKINNGLKDQQVLFVYDDTSTITGSFCQQIEATKEDIPVKCPCNPKENANVVVQDGNTDKNTCDKEYKPYDELFYGDPSMSTILNACYEEDKLKYNFTKEYNINGNDIMYNAEYESKYSFQVKSDDFGVCELYCRDESRFYIANKLSVRAGQHLKYDIGQSLLDKKLINETVGDKNGNHNYMPSVVLEFRECTSKIDYNKWEKLYTNAKDKKTKNQLLYSIYNCNLYSTEDILKKIPSVLNKDPKNYYDVTNNNKAEPAMIDYRYDVNTGLIFLDKIYGTTKDYLLTREGCTSLGYSADKCSRYNIADYDDSYLDSLGINIESEHGLVKSNLNETIYCSGEGCYKFEENGKYLYNPSAKNKNEYTTVDRLNDSKPESKSILNYSNWGLDYKSYDKNSKNYKKKTINGIEVPTNEYASFIVVTETGYFNSKDYYADRYTGTLSTDYKIEPSIIGTDTKDPGVNQIKLDKNIYPLHLEKETGVYNIHHKYNILTSPYERSNYYKEKNYSLFDNIKINSKSDVDYYCTYDLYNTTTKYEKSLGITYRPVDLANIFESVTNEARKLPENWSSKFAQDNRSQIEASSIDILEKHGDNDDVSSYLEYSYVLTPQGVEEIKKVAKLGEKLSGYSDNTLYGCEYDENEQISYNCKSIVLTLLEKNNSLTDGFVEVIKGDGISEFCQDKNNENEPWCKYQQKSGSLDLVGGE